MILEDHDGETVYVNLNHLMRKPIAVIEMAYDDEDNECTRVVYADETKTYLYISNDSNTALCKAVDEMYDKMYDKSWNEN